MITLYIGSTTPYSGKSLLCIGLGRQFEDDGLKISYLKPLGTNLTKVNDQITDEDAFFIEKVLALDEPLEVLCPVVVTQDMIIQAYKNRIEGLEERILRAHNRLSENKDLILIGGGRNLYDGSYLGLSGMSLIKRMDARVIIIDKYEDDPCSEAFSPAQD